MTIGQKSIQAVSSRVAPDGIYKALPAALLAAMSPGPLFMEKSGLLDLVAVVAKQGEIYFPFPAKIIAVYSRVRTQLQTGAGVASLGIIGTLTKFGSQSHPISAVAGTEYVWTITNSGEVAAGDVVTWSGDGGATTAGDIDGTFFWQPRV